MITFNDILAWTFVIAIVKDIQLYEWRTTQGIDEKDVGNHLHSIQKEQCRKLVNRYVISATFSSLKRKEAGNAHSKKLENS